MLSTAYRLRLESICTCIANKHVPLEDMIWAEKLAKRHTTARDWLNKARRHAAQDIEEWTDFMNKMGLEILIQTTTKRDLMEQMTLMNGSEGTNQTTGVNVTKLNIVKNLVEKIAELLNAEVRYSYLLDHKGYRAEKNFNHIRGEKCLIIHV